MKTRYYVTRKLMEMSTQKGMMYMLYDSQEEQFEIWNELKDLIPALTEEESAQLEKNILAEGIRESIILAEIDSDWVLIDGHNRFRIACKHLLDIRLDIREDFADKQAVIEWMIANQLGKRNLTEAQKSYLRGKQYQAEKKEAHRPTAESDKLDKMSSLPNTPAQTTAEKLAKQHKVSAKTIQRDAQFAEAIDTIANGEAEVKQKILNKEIAISKTEIAEIAQAEPEKIEKVRQAIRAGEKPSPKHKEKKEVKVGIDYIKPYGKLDKFTERKENLQNVNSQPEKVIKLEEKIKFLEGSIEVTARLKSEVEKKNYQLRKLLLDQTNEIEYLKKNNQYFFVQNGYNNQPKNKLESDLYDFLREQDCKLITDTHKYLDFCEQKVDELNKKYPRCTSKVLVASAFGDYDTKDLGINVYIGDYNLKIYTTKLGCINF